MSVHFIVCVGVDIPVCVGGSAAAAGWYFCRYSGRSSCQFSALELGDPILISFQGSGRSETAEGVAGASALRMSEK